MNGAQSFSTDVLLRDGVSAHIRAIRPGDRSALQKHFATLSPLSVRFRFFSSKAELSDTELDTLVMPDFEQHVGLVLTQRLEGAEVIIGVGRYFVVPESKPRRAEVAFAVSDAHQGRGAGTLLFDRLLEIARRSGIEELEADVLGENNRMIEVFAASGMIVARSLEHGVVHVRMKTTDDDAALQHRDARERHSARESMVPILSPRSVAVIGASRAEKSTGRAVVKNLLSSGFTGPIYPINPRAETLEGIRVYSTLASVGQPIDLAVIATPAAAVEGAIEACAAAGVRGVVILSAGFAEASAEGSARQTRIRDRVRSAGMRLVGPNCLGVINTDPAVALNASFAPNTPVAGNVAMLSQSGALGLAMLDQGHTRGVGISSFVSVGNKADVSGNDLLSYWSEDPRTHVIALYLESFGNPRKLARIAPEVARKKMIVAVKSGRSKAGGRAAASHTSALASADVAVDALFAQAGIHRTDTLEELFDVVAFHSAQPCPLDQCVAVVTNAGGPAILFADAAEARGLELPVLSDGTANPIDLLADAKPEDFERAIACAGADPAIDAVVAIYAPPQVTDPVEVARAIARGAGKMPGVKPIAAVFLSAEAAPAELNQGPRGTIPCYTFPENAARAVAAAVEHRRWRQRPRGDTFVLDVFAKSTIRSVVDRVQRNANTRERWLDPNDVALILRAAGIAQTTPVQTSLETAEEDAERLGYPLVMKAVVPEVVHKSDHGLVLLGLANAGDVGEAARTLAARAKKLKQPIERLLLQREARAGLEMFAGVTVDPQFGPLVACGRGGVEVELYKDVAFRLTPVTELDANEMIEGLRSAPLFDGFRGAPLRDRAAFAGVVQRLSAIVETAPELCEIDLNPVIVFEQGAGASVVDARMKLG